MRGDIDRMAASTRGRMRSRLGRVVLVALAAALTLGGECDPKRSSFFDPIDDDLIPGLGDIFGTVTVDGEGRSGLTVTVRQGAQVVGTATTDANGDYEVINLDPGTYTVSIGAIADASCPGDRTATVVADDDTRVDFDCTTTPTTGTVTGTVTANGSPVPGATVALDGRTATTDANGAFSFTAVDAGTHTVTVTADGFSCDPRTTTVTAGQTSTVDVSCASTAPSGTEIAANPYRLMGTLMGTDGCGFGGTISNPGPITIRFDPATNTVTIESDADVAGTYAAGQPWTGTGESTFSSGGMSFVLRETAMGTWQRSSGTVVLPGILRFEIFQGSTEQCESAYNATYEALAPSSIRFKRDVDSLLPDGMAIFGLRPVTYRYLAPYGDPTVQRMGLIAEEVREAFPEAVALDAHGAPMGIYYGSLRIAVGEEIVARGGEAMLAAIVRLAEAVR
jgi:hypothetical protein